MTNSSKRKFQLKSEEIINLFLLGQPRELELWQSSDFSDCKGGLAISDELNYGLLLKFVQLLFEVSKSKFIEPSCFLISGEL